MDNHRTLVHLVHIWPPLDEVGGVGSKEQLITNLDVVASTYTASARPTTQVLKPGDPFPNGCVIKRSHSDAANHVLMPTDTRQNWETISQMPSVPNAVWLAQTYAPLLHRAGEWRVLIVGGRPLYVVHTIYNNAK
jgi:hypothetical protein